MEFSKYMHMLVPWLTHTRAMAYTHPDQSVSALQVREVIVVCLRPELITPCVQRRCKYTVIVTCLSCCPWDVVRVCHLVL